MPPRRGDPLTLRLCARSFQPTESATLSVRKTADECSRKGAKPQRSAEAGAGRINRGDHPHVTPTGADRRSSQEPAILDHPDGRSGNYCPSAAAIVSIDRNIGVSPLSNSPSRTPSRGANPRFL
jgi:hypothetical protein